MKNKEPDKLKRILQPRYLIWVLLFLLFAERLLLFRQLGPDYLSYSDDEAYIKAGLYFAKTGTISMWGPYPSAMIMPAMPVIIGCFSFLFGDGTALLTALKILWICMGVLTAYICYKTVCLFSSGWGGLFAAAHFLIPNMAWMNHVLLTETPYMLFLVMTLYYTFRLGQTADKKVFLAYLLSFMAGLMFRANMLMMPVFTLFYLALNGNITKQTLKRTWLFICVLLMFIVPWSFRNYIQFWAFIPITYGAGNPMLLGTYQGENYPPDERLDYAANVDAVMREEYPDYYSPQSRSWPVSDENRYYIEHFDPDGDVKDLKQAQFLSLQADGIKARYRMREWFRNNRKSFLKSYLYIKPRWMLNWSWAWEEAFGVPYSVLHRISQINAVFCTLTVALTVCLKRSRKPVLFLGAAYVITVFLYATSFVSDRYASTLMAYRYMIAGIGSSLILEIIAGMIKKGQKEISS